MSELAETERPAIMPYTGEDWSSLMATADVVLGSDLERATTLAGIPLVIVRAVIRPGDYIHGRLKDGELIPGTGCGYKHPYANLTLITGPADEIARAIRRGRVTEDQASLIDPGEMLSVNVAGTGAYRQVIEYLSTKGYVGIPAGPESGPFGECRYDSLPSDWTTDPRNLSFTAENEPVCTFDIRLACPRGFRISEYENEYTKEGRTPYLG